MGRWLLIATVALMAARLAVQLVLIVLNEREAARWRAGAPEWLQGAVDEEKRLRSIDYTVARSRLAVVSILLDASVLAAVVFSGVIPWSYRLVASRLGTSVPGDAAWLVALGMVLSIPSLPLEWWAQFRLEERFGFNRSTLRLWIFDRLKGGLIGIVLGYPLLCLVLALVRHGGTFWWFWGFLAVTVLQLVMVVLFPRVILPLFNRLEPLAEGNLRDRLVALAERSGFRVAAIQVMDGSRRSMHSNAFFTGFGAFRRIVLFDTLVSTMGESEVEAVLAHEIGHSRKGHVARGMVLSSIMTLLGFWLVDRVLAWGWVSDAFGVAAGELAPALALVGLLSGLVGFWLSPFANALSRRYEFQADAFAREHTGGPDALVSALTSLATSNLSNLTPHPWYARFYHSHPSWAERRAALLSR